MLQFGGHVSAFLARIQTVARLFGVELRRSSPASRLDMRLALMLSQNNIADVIDVGANEGQFAQSVLNSGFMGNILSVEPQPDIHASLKRLADRTADGRWRVAEPVALSDTEGYVDFHLTQSRAASSMLKPDLASASRISEIGLEKTIFTKTMTLDSLLEAHHVNPHSAFLKIDVQGAEKKVLEGAGRALPKMRGAIIELSTIQLYDSQPLMHELLNFMINAGFDVWDIEPGFRNVKTGKMEQCDVTFLRSLDS
jgi:FkbM family methyltransferase